MWGPLPARGGGPGGGAEPRRRELGLSSYTPAPFGMWVLCSVWFVSPFTQKNAPRWDPVWPESCLGSTRCSKGVEESSRLTPSIFRDGNDQNTVAVPTPRACLLLPVATSGLRCGRSQSLCEWGQGAVYAALAGAAEVEKLLENTRSSLSSPMGFPCPPRSRLCWWQAENVAEKSVDI